MCGIAGTWDADEIRVEGVLDRIHHRGPDDRGRAPVGGDDRRTFGHTRLSIVDIAGGHQPFVHPDGTTMVGNGEIYNAPLLRPAMDAAFSTRSDNEVILHLLGDGPEATERMYGMFAFAWSDGDELILGRDRMGIKPLYVGDCGGGLVFASEVKALPHGTTNVRALTPGTTWSSASGSRSFWDVPDPAPAAWDLAESAQAVRDALEQAVEARLMADVPVGAFLSGGLDSSAICALMAGMVDELHTFTVGLEGSPDLIAARIVAEHLGTIHHERIITADKVTARVAEVVVGLESFDQDLVRSSVPTWFVSKLAAEHVKVVLTGEGADELFAGYSYHKELEDPQAVHADARRALGQMHEVNLQRVDRMTMAHSLEARVPFLDTRVIETALSVPPALRMPEVGGIEKAVLREAVADLLPYDIVWRDKAQFDEGSGTADLLPTLESLADGIDVDDYRARYPGTPLRSAEECAYHRMLVEGVEAPEVVLPTVARWTDRDVAPA